MQGNVQRGHMGEKGLVETQKQWIEVGIGGDGGAVWVGKKMEKRKGRKRDKAEQVLIGERPGGECQRYLLSQRGLRCEARLSRGSRRCEVIMGKRGVRQRHLDGETPGERKDKDRQSECGNKAGCRNNGRVGRNNRLRWIKSECV